MNYILIPLLIVLVVMVVVSLVRGIIAFLNSTKLDLEQDRHATGATEMQLLQNKMMFSRIKYQFLAIAVVGLIAVVAS
jgi:hypothetical protein